MTTPRSFLRGVLAPYATTFMGVGGLLFHSGHGMEHLLCLVVAVVMAVGGLLWGVWNNWKSTRRKEPK